MKHGTLLLLTGAMVLLVGCAQKDVAPNDEFAFKSVAEQQQFEKRALSGDGVAAQRMTNYYFFYRNDPHHALRWAKVGAAHGDKVSTRNARNIKKIIAEQQ